MDLLPHFPVLLLTGARQVGKSTLAHALIDSSWNARYLTLDDRTILDAALRDPDGLLSGVEPPVVLDEIQKAPDLLRALKRLVDRDSKPGQYLLTGSANIMTLGSVSETLAGRVALLTLQPFSWSEWAQKPLPSILKTLFEAKDTKEIARKVPRTLSRDRRGEVVDRILIGGYPRAALMGSPVARSQWFSSYRQTYLERDLFQIRAIENLPDFNRLLSLVAFRTGGLLNLSDLAREVDLPFSTLRRYVNLLEVTYQILLLRPYHAHSGKRLVKTPKVYFSDTGMACHLRGIEDWAALERQGREGAMVETWVANELSKILPLLDHRFRLYFWRTHTGWEVDFLVERGERLVALEVKWSHRIDNEDVEALNRCARDLGEKLCFSVFLYSGSEVVPLGPKTIALPFSIFFGIEE